MMRTLVSMFFVAVSAITVVSRDATAEEVCKTITLKNPALTLSEAYSMAEGHAKAWKADAVPASIGNTINGPLQSNGSSVAWSLIFYSDSAKAHVSITTFRGTYRCWADEGEAGRLPDLKPDFMRDGAKLYALAKEHGEALLVQGYSVMIATAAAPSTRHATWRINYSKPDGADGGVSLIVDANSGTVERVLK